MQTDTYTAHQHLKKGAFLLPHLHTTYTLSGQHKEVGVYMPDWIPKYWMEVIFGLIVGVLTARYKRLANKIKEQEAIKLGIQALLRDRIIQSYNHYQEKEYCPIYALENVIALYTQYHALGGNGTVTELVERLKDMPTEKRKGVI